MTTTVPTPDPADEGDGLAELADLIHKAIDPHGVEAACPEDGEGFVACWAAAEAVLAAGYLSPAEVEAKVAAAKVEVLRESARDAANAFTEDSVRGYAIWLWNTEYAKSLTPRADTIATTPAPALPVVSAEAVEALAALCAEAITQVASSPHSHWREGGIRGTCRTCLAATERAAELHARLTALLAQAGED